MASCKLASVLMPRPELHDDHGSKIRGSDQGTFAGAGGSDLGRFAGAGGGRSDVQLDKEITDKVLTIQRLPEKDRDHILFTLDAMLRDAKARAAYS